MKKNTVLVKIIFIYLISIISLLCLYVFSNEKIENFNIGYRSKEYKENATVENLEVGKNAIITSVQISSRRTGVGPFDAETETDSQNSDGTIKWTAGNDVSADDNIVRSFDQITWTIENIMELKKGATEEFYAGGVIEIKGEIPESCNSFVKWDLDSMGWAENATISDDGRTFTAQYSMIKTEMTIPGKQTLVAILKVFGAPNGLEIIPTFTVNLLGNEENEVKTITDLPTITSAAPKYNVELERNHTFSNKVIVDLDGDGKNETKGRMYGYGLVLQLCNPDENKELKGIEYPEGEINFDIDLKLSRSKISSSELEDITDECMPILWNYKKNNYEGKGYISDRNMRFGSTTSSAYSIHCYTIPDSERGKIDTAVYNSGNMNMIQNGKKISTTISNYEFDNIFPAFKSDLGIEKYKSNIGCFSSMYFQIFVPDNEASTIENRTYYLTLSDSNFYAKSVSNKETKVQQINTDDMNEVQHIITTTGGYGQRMWFLDDSENYLASNYSTGDAKAKLEESFNIFTNFLINYNNDENIYSASKFIKFDGECVEPELYPDGRKYTELYFQGDMTFNVWYITKKDGTNWINQTEMNNANIEDMLYFENIEDIPEGYICVGEYLESNDNGIVYPCQGGQNGIRIRVKVKKTAEIGKTYGFTCTTKMWTDYVSRSQYSIIKGNFDEWPEPSWTSGNPQYIKTEYDENGIIIPGTHNNYAFGQSLLVIGSNLSLSKTSIDQNTNEKKVNYDIGRNEYDVTYKLTPSLPANQYSNVKLENITLQVKDTLPKGLTYVLESCEYGKPEIIENSDGSTTLIWYIYNCTIGEIITPIIYKAHINEETENGTQYETQAVISEVVGIDGISKVGNTPIDIRTAKTSIQVINLASYILYQITDTPVIEREGIIHYKIVSQNKGNSEIKDLKILDILPYNGDSRGSSITTNANMTIQKIELKKISGEQNIDCSNVKLYMSEDEETRKEIVETINLQDGKWNIINSGKIIDNPCSAIAINGMLEGNTKLEIDIYLKTNRNEAKDKYINIATDKADSSVSMQTALISTSVVDRILDGYIWYDKNGNGMIEEGEEKLSGIKVDLVGENGEEVLNANGEKMPQAITNENGYYIFQGIAKGNYKVKVDLSQIENSELKKVTEKITEIAVDPKITNKFNSNGESDLITKLGGEVITLLEERNVNLGLTLKDSKVQVQLYNDTTKEMIAQETLEGKVTNKYDVSEIRDKILPEYYEIISEKTEGNESGTFELEPQTVKYYCKYKSYSYIVNYLDESGEKIRDSKTAIAEYETKVLSDNEIIDIEGYIYDSVSSESLTISTDDSKNILNIYYIKNKIATIDIKVNKIWNDNNNINGKRPNSIKLILSKVENVTEETKEIIKEELMTEPEENVLNKDSLNSTSEEELDENLLDSIETNTLDSAETSKEEPTVEIEETKETSKEELTAEIEEAKEITKEELTIESEENALSIDLSNNTLEENLLDSIQAGTPDSSEMINQEKTTLISSHTLEVSEEDFSKGTWEYTFTNLPKYDENGNEIKYKVTEETVMFYEATGGEVIVQKDAEGNNIYTATLTNTFTVPTDTVDIKVTKVWNDNNKDRLNSIILVLTGNGKEYTQTLTKDNKEAENIWECTFTGLPKYSDNGAEIVYILSEREVNKGDLDKYIQTIEGYTVTNTLIIKDTEITKIGSTTITSLDEAINYTINYKASLDANYADGVTVTIVDTLPYEIDMNKPYNLKDGIYDSKNKTITWIEVIKAPVDITKDILLVYKDIDMSATTITNNVKGSIELANGEKEEAETSFDTTTNFTKEITLNNVWIGDNETLRPDSITVTLKATIKGINEAGEESNIDYALPETLSKVNLKASDNWTYTWNDLQKYDQNTKQEITYSVQKIEVPGYYNSLKQEGNVFTLTNYKYGNITITKVDSKNKTVKLGGAEFKLEKLIEDNGKIIVDNSFTAITKITSDSEETKGKASFANLEHGKYRLTETKAPEGYNLLNEPIDIEISKENIEINLEISNKEKTLLPATGGKGVVTLTAVGVLSIVIAMGLNNTLKVSNKVANRSTKVNNETRISRITKSNLTKEKLIKTSRRKTKRTKHRY